jgi:hypothetical protein
MVTACLTSNCRSVRDDVGVGEGLREVMQGEPSTGFGDDDEEQFAQCLQHVNGHLIMVWKCCLISQTDCLVSFLGSWFGEGPRTQPRDTGSTRAQAVALETNC